MRSPMCSRPPPLTVRPPHGIVQVGRDSLPQEAVFRVAQVHSPQMVVIAPVAAVFEEVGFVVVEPHERCVHALQRQAEVADWPRVTLLHVVVLEHPVLETCGHENSVNQYDENNFIDYQSAT